MKRSTIFTGGRPFEIIPKSEIQNQKKKFGTHFGPLFKEKRLPP
jgi:hypothetical protein